MQSKSLFLAASFLALACDNGPREVEVLLDDKIGGFDGENIRFATFGFATGIEDNEEELKMVIVASEEADFCARFENADAQRVLDDAGTGQIPGDFVFTSISFAVANQAAVIPAAGVTLKGDKVATDDGVDQRVDPRFLVSNGAGFQVEADDIEQEGQLDILSFDGAEMKANLFVTLNLEEGGGGLFGGGGDLNNFMSLQILRAPLCQPISDLLQSQFEN